jgi:hypothetical protein
MSGQYDPFEYLAHQQMGLSGGQAVTDDQIVNPKSKHGGGVLGTLSLDRNRLGHRCFLSLRHPHRPEIILDFLFCPQVVHSRYVGLEARA